MPEYSTPKVTPTETTKIPGMNGNSSGYIDAKDLLDIIRATFGQANGVATLGSDGKLTSSQLPDLADDVLVYGSYALLPNPGIEGKLYITADTNEMYRWDGTQYVVLSIDLSAYATKAELAAEESAREAADTDLKNALTAVDHRVQNLEQAKGDYVPVDSDKGVITTPSGKGKWAVVEKLRGVSRAENQLFDISETPTGTSNGITNTVSGNVITFSGTASASYLRFLHNAKSISNHTVLLYNAGTLDGYATVVINGATQYKTVYAHDGLILDNCESARFYAQASSGATLSGTIIPIIRDLTLYFGSTVPTLAEIQTYYPWLLSPSDYGNSLVDSVYEGVVSVFKNLAQINSFTQSTSYGQTVPCNLRKGITYTVSGTASGGSTMRLLKSDGSYQYVAITATINATFVAEDDISEASFYGSLTISNLQIEQGSSKTTFSEYHAPSTLSLPTPITLRSAGSVAEEFDLKTGEKTNPLGSVDLGTLTWAKLSQTFFYAQVTTKKKGSPVVCDRYAYGGIKGDAEMASAATGIYVGYTTQEIKIKDDSLIGMTTSEFRAAMSGVMLLYELATPNAPTQLVPIQNPTILTESGGTISAQTEEPIDGNFSVGFITL